MSSGSVWDTKSILGFLPGPGPFPVNGVSILSVLQPGNGRVALFPPVPSLFVRVPGGSVL